MSWTQRAGQTGIAVSRADRGPLVFGRLRIAAALFLLSVHPALSQTLHEGCVVSALNRSMRVDRDGGWVLPNLPTNSGQVRIRATCVDNGVTHSGSSGLVTIPPNGDVEVQDIQFADARPIAERLQLSAPVSTLTVAGQEVQVAATAFYPGGGSVDVSSAADGTNYRTSNAAVATVDAGGRVTAHASGVALVSALNEGALGVVRIDVVLAGDSDGDGLPDDWELAHGLDPKNALDAGEDVDADSLSTLTEYQLGTDPFRLDSDGDGIGDGAEVGQLHSNPLLADTDGDGLWDGLEVQTGSDPLDPSSFNLAAALASLEVSPADLLINVNTVLGEGSRQLAVVGHLIDGHTLNITERRYGTSYASSNLFVANFGAEDGIVFAGQDGTATLTVSNGSQQGTAQVTVATFAPAAISHLSIPGFANGVAVSGDHAYLAAGAAGLQVVDVSDLAHPFIAGAAALPGNANDVRIVGSLAYVAAGRAGLQIVDIATPSLPARVGGVSTPGAATDLVVAGGAVYVVDELGLRIIDVSTPSSPVLLGGVNTPGRARGVDVAGTIAIVAASEAGVQVVDVSDPEHPRIVGSTATRSNGESVAADVAVRGRLAYVADGMGSAPGLGGLRIVDFRDPGNPVVIGSSGDQFGLTGVVLEDGLALASDYFYVNSVPIFAVPGAEPLFRSVLGFNVSPEYRDDNGNGLAVQGGVVFMAGSRGPILDNGTTGDSALHIGRYVAQGDQGGNPPVVQITDPVSGAVARERQRVTVRARATDDVAVRSVSFLVNGQRVATAFSVPYEASILVPSGSTTLRLGAVANDFGGNEGSAPEVLVGVQANPAPMITLVTPLASQHPLEGTRIPLVAQASDDVAVARVEFYVNAALAGVAFVPPYRVEYTIPVGATELSVTAYAYDQDGPSDPAGPVVMSVQADRPPFVAIVAPQDGSRAVAGSTLDVTVAAIDDLGVSQLRLLVNAQVAGVLNQPPAIHAFRITVPAGSSPAHLVAQAVDTRGQIGASSEVLLEIGDDPLTEASGEVLDASGGAVAGAIVRCAGRSGVTDLYGTFLVAGVPTATGLLSCNATFEDAQRRRFVGSSRLVVPAPGGVTDVGTIALVPATGALYGNQQIFIDGLSAVAVADLNGDEVPDLVAVTAVDSSQGEASVMLGKREGGYQAAQSYAIGSFPQGLAIADFNGDGRLDVVAVNYVGSSGEMSTLLGNGDGTLQSELFRFGGGYAVAAGDFNRDGAPDVAILSNFNLSIKLGNGDGTFANGQVLSCSESREARVLPVDVNADGILDLVVPGRLFLGHGDGTFAAAQPIPGAAQPSAIAVADLNEDGYPDLVVSDNSSQFFGLVVHLSNGAGSFDPAAYIAVENRSSGVVAADVNADGAPDLLVANIESAHIHEFLGDGHGGFGVGPTINAGGGPDVLASTEDLNHDGVADLLVVNYIAASTVSIVYGGAGRFTDAIEAPAGESPDDVIVADLDADGFGDLAVASYGSNQALVLRGRGDGTVESPQAYEVGTGPAWLASADLNGDGRRDLVVANDSSASVSVFLGQGSGPLAAQAQFAVGNCAEVVESGDLNGDGVPDLVTANACNDDVSVLLGNGDGSFQDQIRSWVGSLPVNLALQDLNRDGKLDVVTVNLFGNDVSVLLGNGDGTFQAQQIYPVGDSPTRVAAGDLDGDGTSDLVVANEQEISVLLGTGEGAFMPETRRGTGLSPGGLILADVDTDGILDVVLLATDRENVAILPGDGTAGFKPAQIFGAGKAPYGLGLGDLNGDGLPDLVMTNQVGNLWILLHQ